MSEEKREYKLSVQAVGALMMTVQKAFLAVEQGDEENSDVGNLLKEWKLVLHGDEIVVVNPPVISVDTEGDEPKLDFGE